MAEFGQTVMEQGYSFSLVEGGEEQAILADFFAKLLIRPLEEDVLETYRTKEISKFLADLGEELQCFDVMRSLLAQLNEGDVSSVQRHLAWMYTMLFEGVSGPRNISLYESGYYEGGTRLFQQPFIEMQAILKKLDVSVEQSCKEPADHISLELAAFAEAIRQDEKDEIASLHQRLMGWVPKLATDVGDAIFGSFYHNVLFLLDAYLTSFPVQSNNFDENVNY